MKSLWESVGGDRDGRPLFLHFRSSSRLILWTTTFAYFQDGFVYGVIVPVLPFALQARFGVPDNAVQFWNSMFLVTFGLSQVIGGPCAGYWVAHSPSHRTPFLVGLICEFAATALFMFAPSIWVLVVARVIQGLSAAVVNTLGLSLLAETVDPNRLGFYMGIALSGMTLGILIAPPLAGVVYEKAGYPFVFLMALVVISIDMILRLMIIEKKIARKWLNKASRDSGLASSRETPVNSMVPAYDGFERREPQHDDVLPIQHGKNVDHIDRHQSDETSPLLGQPTRSKGISRYLPTSILLLRSPRISAAVYGCLVHAVLITSFDATLPLFVHRMFGWEADRAGAILLALTLVPLLSFIPGTLADRHGAANIALVGFATATFCILFMGLINTADTQAVVFLTLILFFISIGITMFLSPLAADLAITVETLESKEPSPTGSAGARTQVYSLFNAAMGAGTVVGPVLSGVLYHYTNWLITCSALAIICFSGSVPVILYMRKRRKAIR